MTSSTVTELGWEQARRHAHQLPGVLPARPVGLVEAIGCVLAEDLLAGCDLPAGTTSAMDGWAINGPPPWSVVGASLAGRAAEGAIGRGQAMVIATGALVPPGATGIVRSEHGVLDVDRLRLRDGVTAVPDLSDVRPRGHEATAGELLVAAGVRVRPPIAGLAAAAGYDTLRVQPRPRVSVLVLGDELLDSGQPRGGAVRDALGVQLPAWVSALGGEPAGVLRVADDAESTLAAVRADQGRSDVLVTTGGSARGAADHLRATLAAIGARIVVDSVDVRPGHPMLLAELPDGRHLVGLPGNPLAALAGVVTLLGPLLAGLSGAVLPELGGAVVEEEVALRPGRRARGHLLIPVSRTVSGGVRSTGYATSAMLRGVALADGFLLVPPEGVRRGEPATVSWFPWAPAGGVPVHQA